MLARRRVAVAVEPGVEAGRPAAAAARRPTLVVADEQDWSSVCEVPIYGMMLSIPDKLGTSPTPASRWQE